MLEELVVSTEGKTDCKQWNSWEQTKVTTRLVVSYFNWIWLHSRYKTTAAQRAGLSGRPWSWSDLATFPTTI